MTEQSKCQGCGAVIRWAKTERGAWLCLDPEPIEDGNVTLDAGGVAHVHGPQPGLFDPPAEGPRYRTHWATCPRARDFRKGKK